MSVAEKIDLILTAIRMICQVVMVGELLVLIKYHKFGSHK